MPRHSFQPPSRSRSSSATRPPQRREERPAVATAADTPRREPDVRRKVWPGPGKRYQGQRRSPRRDTGPPAASKPSSWGCREEVGAHRRPSSQAIQNVAWGSQEQHSQCLFSCMLLNKNAYILTKRALSYLLSQCDAARPTSEQCRATAHTKNSRASLAGSSVDQAISQSLKAWEVIPGFSDVVPALTLERCALFSPHSDVASALMLGLWALTSLFVFIKDYNNF